MHPRVGVVALDEPARERERSRRTHALVAMQRARDEDLGPLPVVWQARAVCDLKDVSLARRAATRGLAAILRARETRHREYSVGYTRHRG